MNLVPATYEDECNLLRQMEELAKDHAAMGNECTAEDYRTLVALCRKLQVSLRKYEGTSRK